MFARQREARSSMISFSTTGELAGRAFTASGIPPLRLKMQSDFLSFAILSGTQF
jgi:hypothetical protein